MLLFEFLLAGYVGCRAVLPLNLNWKWKLLPGAAVLAAAFKFHLMHLFGGPMFFAPELPAAVLLVAAWLFAVLLIFAFLLLGADLLRAAAWIVRRFARRRPAPDARARNNRINAVLLAAAALLAAAGIRNGTAVPEIHPVELTLKRLPPDAEPLTVAVLADLHADALTRAGRIREIVRRVNAARPDLVVILGDFVDGRVETRAAELRPLADLRARFGVFGVPGNHEYYSDYARWRPVFASLGIRMLDNAHVRIGAAGPILAGVTDPAAGRMGGEGPDPARALDGAPPDAVRILLAHQPRLAAEAAAHGVDLQLSGHTHGGMMFGLDRLVAAFNGGFVAGGYRVGAMTLLVSRGSGIWNGFPVRLGVPSEILLLRLRPGR